VLDLPRDAWGLSSLRSSRELQRPLLLLAAWLDPGVVISHGEQVAVDGEGPLVVIGRALAVLLLGLLLELGLLSRRSDLAAGDQVRVLV